KWVQVEKQITRSVPMMETKEEIQPTKNQENKVCIITGKVLWSFSSFPGANCGIGFATAMQLAKLGLHVIMGTFYHICFTYFKACKSLERTEGPLEQIKTISGNKNVEFLQIDLESLDSIRAFVEAFKSKNIPLHVLILNAGIFFQLENLILEGVQGIKEKTKEGFEACLGINHLGHFLLTNLLMDKLKQSVPSR